jgi:plastocyanin
MRNNLLLSGVLGLALLAGCGRSVNDGEKAVEGVSGPALKADEVNGATLTGKVTFTGDKPQMHEIDMSASDVCQKMHATPVVSDQVIVNSNGTLANVFVWVKAGVPEGRWAPPSTPVVIDQKGCLYTPHVVGAVIGQNVEFRNSDQTNHNIHPLPQRNQEWNESEPPNGETKTKTFDREEVMIPLKCNIHPWMRAYIGVVRHPFFAVTGPDGTFTIKGLPPGKYTVEAWHERYGTADTDVTVAAKDQATMNFSFAAPKK